ncbi:MAG: hypothetical protein RBS29_08430 [Bacteroidales bacterium]|nr:hypothetical protein [Bacteroidales bacterium]
MAKQNNTTLLLIITLFLLILSGCKNKKQDEIIIIPDAQKNHLQTSRLKGKIKLIKTTSYYTSDPDSISPNTQLSTVIQHYSSDGWINRIVTLDKNNDTVRIRNVEYDSNGKQLKWLESDLLNKINSYTNYTYDMNGYISSEQFFSSDTLVYTIDYKTDGMGGIIMMHKKKENLLIKNNLFYNMEGLLIRNDEYDPTGKLFKYMVYEYDNYGDEVNRKVYNSFKKLIEYTFTQYDPKGKMVKTIYDNLEHSLREVKTYPEHDPAGNWTFEVFTANNDTIYFRKREIIYY